MSLLTFLILSVSTQVQAQSILVEATRIHEESIEPSRSVSIINEKDLSIRKPTTVAEILRAVPGIEVVQQGGLGQTTSVFIRGARSEDTLVLVDGVQINDGMAPSGGFDFSSLSPANIARIEVYRGPQSVRFGNGALGGVINIITKEGKENTQGYYFFEAGAYESHRVNLGASGKNAELSYAFEFDRFKTQGFSISPSVSGDGEKDGADISTVALKITRQAEGSSKFEGTFRYNDSDVDLDRQNRPDGDDPNNQSRSKQFIASMTQSGRFLNDQLKSDLRLSFVDMKRDNENESDLRNSDRSTDTFSSQRTKIETHHEFLLKEEHTLRLGLQYQGDVGQSKSTFNGTNTNVDKQQQTDIGESLTYLYDDGAWFSDFGLRADQPSRLDPVVSYRASLGKNLPERDLRVYFAVGTGFKIPSLYQLHSVYGNVELHNEKSDAMEFTVEKYFGKSMTALTFFKNNFKDLIDFDLAANKYFNVSKARSQGFELRSQISISALAIVDASYIYTEAVDESSGLELLRRPRHAWNLAFTYDLFPWQGFVKYRHRGDRVDTDLNNLQRVKNSSYEVIDVGGSYAYEKFLKINGRIENIFDTKYEEVVGYATPERSIYLGLAGEF